MEPAGSLPCSQELATCPCPQPQVSDPHLATLFLEIPILISSYLWLGLPSGLFPHQSPVCSCPHRHMHHLQRCLVLRDFLRLTTSGEQYKPWSCSLYNFLQSPVTSSLLDPNIFLSTLSLNTLNRINCTSAYFNNSIIVWGKGRRTIVQQMVADSSRPEFNKLRRKQKALIRTKVK